MISYPPSLELARLPTPLVALERLSARLGCEIRCKRDDLTGAELTGNKTRKLEFFFADALSQGASTVITCGAAQSNHARAAALGAARLGVGCRLLLRTDDPAHPPPLTEGNLLLDALAGASIEWISDAQYAGRDRLLAERADDDDSLYVIPEGGSNAVGAWGYVRCVEELESELGNRPATLVYPVGSGGTAAGLIAGCRLLGLPYRLIGICVAPGREALQRRIAEILTEMTARYSIDVATDPEGIELWDDFVGDGYGSCSDEQLATMIDVARTEGLVTDPVYSGKALHGLLSAIGAGRRLGDPLVFLHTGGLFGLFAQRQRLSALLGALRGAASSNG